MSEAADDILEGYVCQECGEYFDDIIDGKPAPGHPRTCDHCKRLRKRTQRK